MKKNIVFLITLFFISSCSTLAFWSDDSEEEISEPVKLTKIQNELMELERKQQEYLRRVREREEIQAQAKRYKREIRVEPIALR